MNKKILLLFSSLALVFSANTSTAAVKTRTANVITTGDWQKSTDGIWKGANTTWYKRDAKTGNIMVSTDGRIWAVSNGTWQDKDGKTLKIMDGILQWSVATTGTWSQVPDGKWQGPDGTYYKFDKDFALWTMVVKKTDTKTGN